MNPESMSKYYFVTPDAHFGEIFASHKELKKSLDRIEQTSYNKPITQENAVADKVNYIRLEMTEDGHNKFWEATAKGASNAEAGWGKIGASKPQGTKLYTNEELEKVMKEKIKKGYKVVAMK